MSVCINVERSTVAVELNLESVVEPHVVARLEHSFLLLHIRDSDAWIALLDIFLSRNGQLVDCEDCGLVARGKCQQAYRYEHQ